MSERFSFAQKLRQMKKSILLILALGLSVPLLAQKGKDKAAILQILNRQVEMWNAGDVEKFMVGYWANDSLMYIGKSGIQYGYQPTLNNYKKNYPDRAAMGTLKFNILTMKPLGKRHYFVVGKWHLTRPEKGDIGGHFSLIFEKQNGQWVIIADHSS
jgi:hypothetical protein